MYYPNPVGSNKPITIGHEYSSVALLPELGPQMAKSWVVPLATQRVSTADDKELVGAAQIKALLDDAALPWYGELVVNVGDSRYSNPAYLHAVYPEHDELITIAKVRRNRNLYHYLPPPAAKPAHRPPFKGKAFKLHDPATHTQPDKTLMLELKEQQKGREHLALIEVWEDMTMPWKNKPSRSPMEDYPFRLVRITCFDKDGNEVYAQPW